MMTLVRRVVVYPIVGRLLDRWLRRQHGQANWKLFALGAAHSLIENATPAGARAVIAEVINRVGRYLSKESLEVLGHIDEIAKKHSQAAN